MHIFALCYARFSWKLSVKVVFIFSSKTSILVWCGLKQAENGPKTTHVSDPGLSLREYDRFQKPSYSAWFQAENDLYINSGTVLVGFTVGHIARPCAHRSLKCKAGCWLAARLPSTYRSFSAPPCEITGKKHAKNRSLKGLSSV
jgi:hypothetical protein